MIRDTVTVRSCSTKALLSSNAQSLATRTQRPSRFHLSKPKLGITSLLTEQIFSTTVQERKCNDSVNERLCKGYKRRGFCDRFEYRSYMARGCSKTCGLCDLSSKCVLKNCI